MAGMPVVVFLVSMFSQYWVVSTSGCTNSPMDINFVLDSSDDTHALLFEKEKIFTTKLVNELWDGRNQFGLFTFGSNVYSQFHLNTYTSPSEIQQAITYVWKDTGKADVASALEYTVTYGFRDSNGGRVVAPDVIFLITSSDIRNETYINSIITQLQASEIELNVVLVGGQISSFWYEKLATADRIIKIKSATDLATIADNTKRSLCRGRGILRLWSEWSACGSSCGLGLRRRHRTCEKRTPDDVDCEGDLLDEQECLSTPCLDPVDGVWSNWGKWTGCSKTCGNGLRSRQRTCSAPFQRNGGKPCNGTNIQKEPCSVWSCPDCNRKCPSGSHLAKECDVCICSNVVLRGNVQTARTGHPINEAQIYLNSKMYAPIATTDYTGSFSVGNICMTGETVTVEQAGYSSTSLVPKVVNMTHWYINATLTEYVAPVFITHPEEKTRLVGQSVSLCCKALGSPLPDKYTWFKGTDILESRGVHGKLTFDSLCLTDTGKYRCLAETVAGSATSNQAVLTISDGPIDTCTDPKPSLEDLPEGCYVKGDDSRNATIDVRTCGKAQCVSTELHDNGTCAEWWSFHCCDAADKELVDVVCDGFSYQTTRVQSCKCQKCFTTTMITGKAFGRLENGSEIPLKLGIVYGNGKRLSRTNMRGVFSFEVPRRITRLILKFTDEVFKTFLDSTKIISIIPGSNTAVKLALPLRPAPRPFDTSSDLNIEVGGSSDLEPTGRMSVPKKSLVSAKGTPHIGPANAFVHYMDPRKLHDFEASNGEFAYHEDGNLLPLETVGVFSSFFEDKNGDPLYSNKPFSFEIDPFVFNISANADGEPKVELWRMDANSGTWVSAGKMKYQTSGRRRLLREVIVGTDETSVDIPPINLFEPVYETKTVIEYVTMSRVLHHNGDSRIVYYQQARPRTITQRLPDKTKRNACYISVMVYKTFSAKEVDMGTQVTAVTKDPRTNTYIGFDRKPTDKNGHVCLSTFCDSIVYLSAENKNDLTPLQAFPKHDVPRGYNFTNIRNGTQVQLVSSNTLDVMTDSGRRFSPVYYAEDEEGNNLQRCLNRFNDDFKFQFGQSLTKDPKLDVTQPENVYNNKLSWYPIPPDYITRQVCFFKAHIKIRDNYNIRFIATSYQGSQSGGQYGTYNVGPIPEPTYSDVINRAACIEFRCPGLVNDQGTISRDVPTFLDVRVNPNTLNLDCRFRTLAKDLVVNELQGGRGFQVTLQPDKAYGPKYGVYIVTDSRAVVERFCSQGKDTGNVDIGMNPLLNAAVEYDCT